MASISGSSCRSGSKAHQELRRRKLDRDAWSASCGCWGWLEMIPARRRPVARQRSFCRSVSRVLIDHDIADGGFARDQLGDSPHTINDQVMGDRRSAAAEANQAWHRRDGAIAGGNQYEQTTRENRQWEE